MDDICRPSGRAEEGWKSAHHCPTFYHHNFNHYYNNHYNHNHYNHNNNNNPKNHNKNGNHAHSSNLSEKRRDNTVNGKRTS